MIPGSAIGKSSRNVTDSRPKNLNRLIAKAAMEPSTSAIPVAISPHFSDSQSDERTSGSFHAARNQCVVQSVIGQLWMFERLKAYTRMMSSGIHRKRTTPIVQIRIAMRAPLVSTSGPPGAVAELLGSEKQARLGRRERSYSENTGATEDDAWRRFAAARSQRAVPGGPLIRPRRRRACARRSGRGP